MIDLGFAVGVLVLISAAGFGYRGMALSPRMGSWPDAAPIVRAILFGLMCFLAFRGVELINLSRRGGDTGQTTASLWASGMLATYSSVMAWNVLRQVLPPHVWDRLKRLNGLAFCPPKGRLALLAMAGVRVVPPGARTGALVDLETDHSPAAESTDSSYRGRKRSRPF